MALSKHLSTQVQSYIYLRSVASTNAYLSDYIAKSNPSHNICLYTYDQTQGKGQIGRQWFSDVDKNISLSYFIPWNNLPANIHFDLNMTIALALHYSLKKAFGLADLKVKWPNDLYYKNQKLAGLLIQNQLSSKHITNSIIGIGINLNQDKFPSELTFATSIKNITGKEHPLLQSILNLEMFFFQKIEFYLENITLIRQNYLENLFGINQLRKFSDKQGQEFEATIIGIDSDGKLIIDKDSRIEKYNHGEIQFVIE